MRDEQAVPETKGVTVRLLATLDLGPEIEGMAGRRFRMRMVTIEPGGTFGPLHDHKDRPGMRFGRYLALVNRLRASLACAVGTLVVATPFALIELWSNLSHDPFPPPHWSGQAWTVFDFSTYGALFIAALGCGVAFIALTVLGCDMGVRSRTVKLTLLAGGALLYAVLHHSRHVLWYWAPGGTW